MNPLAAARPPHYDVTGFGETMLRLSPPLGERLERASNLAVHVGGAESNVCAALSGLGRQCAWFSKLPQNPIGRQVVHTLSSFGVDTNHVLWSEYGRMGLYFVDHAHPPRASEVTYDRQSSAVTNVSMGEIAWESLLNTRVLHLTGITPALSPTCFEIVLAALTRARAADILVTFDVNYRSRLWSPEQAAVALARLFPLVDVLICGENDAKTVFGFSGSLESLLHQLKQMASNAQHVVLTRGSDGAVALVDHAIVHQHAFPTTVIDQFGAGDAFCAGLIDGILDGSLEEGLERGAFLAALALSQVGDMITVTRRDLSRLPLNSARAVLR